MKRITFHISAGLILVASLLFSRAYPQQSATPARYINFYITSVVQFPKVIPVLASYDIEIPTSRELKDGTPVTLGIPSLAMMPNVIYQAYVRDGQIVLRCTPTAASFQPPTAKWSFLVMAEKE